MICAEKESCFDQEKASLSRKLEAEPLNTNVKSICVNEECPRFAESIFEEFKNYPSKTIGKVFSSNDISFYSEYECIIEAIALSGKQVEYV